MEPDGRAAWDRLIATLSRFATEADLRQEAMCRQAKACRTGEKIAVSAVKASDEDLRMGWSAAKAVDGNVDEPDGYWLTRKNHPSQAWLELTLARPSKINRVVLFHQLNPAHYRSLDYRVCVRCDGVWAPVVTIRGNTLTGWIAHTFPAVLTDAVRLEITRSAYGDRMGVGEFEVRWDRAGDPRPGGPRSCP